jgi:hypothetical protein
MSVPNCIYHGQRSSTPLDQRLIYTRTDGVLDEPRKVFLDIANPASWPPATPPGIAKVP